MSSRQGNHKEILDLIKKKGFKVPDEDFYYLVTLKEPYPGFKKKAILNIEDFKKIKKLYNYRCAICGSKEGKPNFKNLKRITKLQKAHINPLKPEEGIIPQYEECNRAYKDWFIFDKEGKVITIANPQLVLRVDIEVQKEIYKILKEKDALEILNKLDENFVDLVLTDPPYFLDKLDQNWTHENVKKGKLSRGVVKNLPTGMKFSPKQSYKAYNWFFIISSKIIKILKPGGWFLSFSYPRMFHRFACAVEDAGFYLRDIFVWIYTQNQPKAFSLNHFLKDQDEEIKELLKIYKVPKLKSCFEFIIVAQKPPECNNNSKDKSCF